MPQGSCILHFLVTHCNKFYLSTLFHAPPRQENLLKKIALLHISNVFAFQTHESRDEGTLEAGICVPPPPKAKAPKKIAPSTKI